MRKARMGHVRMGYVMTRPGTTVSEETPDRRIVATPTEYGVGAVALLDGARRVAAVVTYADVTYADLSLKAIDLVAAENPSLWKTPRRRKPSAEDAALICVPKTADFRPHPISGDS